MKRLRSEEGIGLVELLIAMTITSIAIMALVASLGAGTETIKRSSATSVAGALADQHMETLRAGSYAAVASSTKPNVAGPDGRTYWMSTLVEPLRVCGSGKLLLDCSADGGAVGRQVKLVTVEVRDGSSSGRLRIRQSSTFDQAFG